MKTFLKKISSRKFLVLLIAVGLFCYSPAHFTGDHMVIVFAVFIGGNFAEKIFNRGRDAHTAD